MPDITDDIQAKYATAPSGDPTDAIQAKYPDPTDAIQAKYANPIGAGLGNAGSGLMAQPNPIAQAVTQALPWSPNVQGPPNITPQIKGQVAGQVGGQAVTQAINSPAQAMDNQWSQALNPQTPQPSPTNPIYKLLGIGTFEQGAQNANENARKDQAQKDLDSTNPSLVGSDEAINKSIGGDPLVKDAQPGLNPINSLKRAIAAPFLFVGDPSGSFRNAPGVNQMAMSKALGTGIPAAIAQAAMANPASLAGVLADTLLYNLQGGVPSDVEGVAMNMGMMGLFHGLTHVVDANAIKTQANAQAAIDGLGLDPQRAQVLKNAIGQIKPEEFKALADDSTDYFAKRKAQFQANDTPVKPNEAETVAPPASPVSEPKPVSESVANPPSQEPGNVQTQPQTPVDSLSNDKPGPIEAPKVDVPPDATGLSMAMRQAEAEQGLRPEPQSVGDMSNADAHRLGQEDVQSGRVDPYSLARTLAEDKRAAKPQEYGALAEGSRQLQAQLRGIDLDGSEESQTAYNAIRNKIDQFDADLDKIKGASGSSMQVLKIATKLDDGQFLRYEYKRNAGSIPSDAEATIHGHEQTIERLQKEADDAKAKLETVQSKPEEIQKAAEVVEARKPKNENPAQRQQRLQKILSKRADIYADYKKSSHRLSANPIEPLYHLGRLGWTFVDELGTVRLPELIDKIKADWKKNTGEEVDKQQIIDAMHEARPVKPMSEFQKEKAKLYSDIRKLNSDALDKAEQKAKEKAEALETAKQTRAYSRAELDLKNASMAEQKAALDKANKQAQAARRANAKAGFANLPKTSEYVDDKYIADQINKKMARVSEIDQHIKNGDVEALTPKTQQKAQYGAEYDAAVRNLAEARSRAKSFVDASKPKTWGDIALKYRRGLAISGTGPLAKIPISTVTSGLTSTIEAPVESLVRKATGIEGETAGRGSLRSGAAAVKTFLSPSTWKEAAQAVGKERSTPLNRQYNNTYATPTTFDKVVGLPGSVHEMLTYPAQKAAYEASVVKMTDSLTKKGVDVTTPEAIETIGKKAYADSLMAVYRNDNWLANSLSKRFTSKSMPNAGKLLEAMIAPVLKLPTNVAGRIAEYAGGGMYAAVKTLKAKFEGRILTGAEQDAIVRAISRQGIGAGAIALGYYMNVKSDDLPSLLQHVPIARAMAFGGILRQQFEDRKASMGSKVFGSGLLVGRDIAENVPAAEGVQKPLDALMGDRYKDQKTDSAGKAAADYLLGWLVPQGVTDAAKFFDPQGVKDQKQYYKSQGFVSEVEKSIPVLRQKLPVGNVPKH